MLQVLIITMREGIEAFLIVAITAGILRQTGRSGLLPAVYWGTGIALIASFIAAISCIWLTMISCAMRRSCSFLP